MVIVQIIDILLYSFVKVFHVGYCMFLKLKETKAYIEEPLRHVC